MASTLLSGSSKNIMWQLPSALYDRLFPSSRTNVFNRNLTERFELNLVVKRFRENFTRIIVKNEKMYVSYH